jgi:hypothetical protein
MKVSRLVVREPSLLVILAMRCTITWTMSSLRSMRLVRAPSRCGGRHGSAARRPRSAAQGYTPGFILDAHEHNAARRAEALADQYEASDLHPPAGWHAGRSFQLRSRDHPALRQASAHEGDEMSFEVRPLRCNQPHFASLRHHR